jgi:hypothetical protein
MSLFSKIANITRSPGDPQVIESGPSMVSSSDRLAKKLGWFSIGLGLAELLGANSIARGLGMRGREGLVRLFGVREIMAGVMCLSTEKHVGIWSRVAGDALDLTALLSTRDSRNPKRGNVDLALFAVAGITLLDIIAAEGLAARHSRGRGGQRDYSDRSGLRGGSTYVGTGKRRSNGQDYVSAVGD